MRSKPLRVARSQAQSGPEEEAAQLRSERGNDAELRSACGRDYRFRSGKHATFSHQFGRSIIAMETKLEKEVRFLKIYAAAATLLCAVFLLSAFAMQSKKPKFEE